jgi:hypothetical protein
LLKATAAAVAENCLCLGGGGGSAARLKPLIPDSFKFIFLFFVHIRIILTS